MDGAIASPSASAHHHHVRLSTLSSPGSGGKSLPKLKQRLQARKERVEQLGLASPPSVATLDSVALSEHQRTLTLGARTGESLGLSLDRTIYTAQTTQRAHPIFNQVGASERSRGAAAAGSIAILTTHTDAVAGAAHLDGDDVAAPSEHYLTNGLSGNAYENGVAANSDRPHRSLSQGHSSGGLGTESTLLSQALALPAAMGRETSAPQPALSAASAAAIPAAGGAAAAAAAAVGSTTSQGAEVASAVMAPPPATIAGYTPANVLGRDEYVGTTIAADTQGLGMMMPTTAPGSPFDLALQSGAGVGGAAKPPPAGPLSRLAKMRPHKPKVIKRMEQGEDEFRRRQAAKALGKIIGKEHEQYQLSYAMMLGIYTSVVATASATAASSAAAAASGGPSLAASTSSIAIGTGGSGGGGGGGTAGPEGWRLALDDFMKVRKLVFPPSGSPLTPPHPLSTQFKFKDYAPKAFHALRERFAIDQADYLRSLGGAYEYIEFNSNSKSGSFFFYSHDGRYMIKTQTRAESKFLRRILAHYYSHVMTYPHSYITRFFGMHRLKMPHLRRKIHFVVMQSVFASPDGREVHEMYDLKGSSVGRSASEAEKARGPSRCVYKDNDLVEAGAAIKLGPGRREAFLAQIRVDAAFLERMGIMDYSLLLGIHYRSRAHTAEGHALVRHGGAGGISNASLPLAQTTGGGAAGAIQTSRESSFGSVEPQSAADGFPSHQQSMQQKGQPWDVNSSRIETAESARMLTGGSIFPTSADVMASRQISLVGSSSSAAAVALSPPSSSAAAMLGAGTGLSPVLINGGSNSGNTNSTASDGTAVVPFSSMAIGGLEVLGEGPSAAASAGSSGGAGGSFSSHHAQPCSVPSFSSIVGISASASSLQLGNGVGTAAGAGVAGSSSSSSSSEAPAIGGGCMSDSPSAAAAGGASPDVDGSSSVYTVAIGAHGAHVSGLPAGARQPPPGPSSSAGGGIMSMQVVTSAAAAASADGVQPQQPQQLLRPGDEIYFLGIIDILQQYDLRKMGETAVKSLVHPSKDISAVSPHFYAQRFVRFLEQHTQ